MDGNYNSIKQLNGGRQLLVHFDYNKYSENLLNKTDKLVDIPVKVSPLRTLNYKQCAIFCKELAGMDEEEIANKLKSQGVVKFERMKRRKDGQLIPADSYILTVVIQTIPKEIKVGFLNKETKVYIPNPLRCFNCLCFQGWPSTQPGTCTQPCPHCSHSRAPGEQWARLCVFTLQGCVQAARLCRGSPVVFGHNKRFCYKKANCDQENLKLSNL